MYIINDLTSIVFILSCRAHVAITSQIFRQEIVFHIIKNQINLFKILKIIPGRYVQISLAYFIHYLFQ